MRRQQRKPTLDIPRILAIADVHLTALADTCEAMSQFYGEVLSLTPLTRLAGESDQSDENQKVFCGLPRTGPKLVIEFMDELPEKPQRRQLLLQISSLSVAAEIFRDQQIEFQWSRGWFWYDKRILVMDPGGNWIELITSHSW